MGVVENFCSGGMGASPHHGNYRFLQTSLFESNLEKNFRQTLLENRPSPANIRHEADSGIVADQHNFSQPDLD